MDIGFAINYQHVVEFNAGTQAAPDWAWAGPGISSITPSNSETSEETAYFDGGGNTTTDVTGVSKSYAISGKRRYGDKFQDWVASLDGCSGEALKTQMRITNPDGECVEYDVTVHNISAKGPNGEANAKTDFSCTASCNGLPRLVKEAEGTALPETVAAQAVTAKVGQTVAISATTTPAGASSRCLFAVEDASVAAVDSEGNVTGVKVGKTRVAVKCAARPSVYAYVDVTVSSAA